MERGSESVDILVTLVVGTKLARCLSKTSLDELHGRLSLCLLSQAFGRRLHPYYIRRLIVMPGRRGTKLPKGILLWRAKLPAITHLRLDFPRDDPKCVYLMDYHHCDCHNPRFSPDFVWRFLATEEDYPSLRVLDILRVDAVRRFRPGSGGLQPAYPGLRRLHLDLQPFKGAEELFFWLLNGLPRPELIRNFRTDNWIYPLYDAERQAAAVQRLSHLNHISGRLPLNFEAWSGGEGLLSTEMEYRLAFASFHHTPNLRRVILDSDAFRFPRDWSLRAERAKMKLYLNRLDTKPGGDLEHLHGCGLGFSLTCLKLQLCFFSPNVKMDKYHTRTLGHFIDGFARLRHFYLQLRVVSGKRKGAQELSLGLAKAPLELFVLDSNRPIHLYLTAETGRRLKELRWAADEVTSLTSLRILSNPPQPLSNQACKGWQHLFF